MSVSVKLPVFEGPLDLLLHLIEKNQVDIIDIPIYEITKQYLEYLDEWNHESMEIASEFIVMAATLIRIKARMLLPSETKEEEEEDPREELIRRLLEYKRYKEAAVQLKTHIPSPDRLWNVRSKEILKIPTPKPDIRVLLNGLTPEIIYETYKLALQNKADSIDPTRSTFTSVAKDSYTIDSKIRDLMETLERLQTVSFYQLRKQSHSRQEEITYFLAMLELNRSSLVYLKQENAFEDIFMVPVPEEKEEPTEQEIESNEQEPIEETSEEVEEIVNETSDNRIDEVSEIADIVEVSETVDIIVTPSEVVIEESAAFSSPIPVITQPTINNIEPSEPLSSEEVIETPETIVSEETEEPVETTVSEETEEMNEPEVSEEIEEQVELDVPEPFEETVEIEVSEEVEETIAPEVSEEIEEQVELEAPEPFEETVEIEASEEAEESIDPGISEELIETEVSEEIEDEPEEEIEEISEEDAEEESEEEIQESAEGLVIDLLPILEMGQMESENVERIDEDERGDSDPKKSRAAGA